MRQYHTLLEKILVSGAEKEDRTGTGTLSLFGEQIRFSLVGDTIPVLTTKKIHFKSVLYELLWMISGNTNIRWLQNNGVSIWDEWADAQGNLGKVYGYQWRTWNGHLDQLTSVIDQIKKDPYSRRHVVSAWNGAEIKDMALAPCHALFQFYVDASGLSCNLYQRSADAFLGLPFNIASYAILTRMVAQVVGLPTKELVISLGDAHIYKNHVEQTKEMLRRDHFPDPVLELPEAARKIDDFILYRDKIKLSGYQHHPQIKAPIAV